MYICFLITLTVLWIINKENHLCWLLRTESGEITMENVRGRGESLAIDAASFELSSQIT